MLAGLDHSNESILGIDFFQHGARPGNVYVYAVNTAELGIDIYEAMRTHLETNKSLPVTSVLLHDVDARRIIEKVFKSYHVQLRARGWEDARVSDRQPRGPPLPRAELFACSTGSR